MQDRWEISRAGEECSEGVNVDGDEDEESRSTELHPSGGMEDPKEQKHRLAGRLLNSLAVGNRMPDK